MACDLAVKLPQAGFNFDNCMRNSLLSSKGFTFPNAKKTGTTIAGIKCGDAVILGADTRATVGSLIAEKNCEKIHYLAKNMYVCGAGTAADTHQVSKMVSAGLELHRLNTGRKHVPVVAAEKMFTQHLFRYQGHIGCAMIIGGVDFTGPHLYNVSPWGHSDEKPYQTMGSGCLAAMSVFEKGWRPNMSIEEGMLLVRDAIAAGVFNDLGSGSNIDLCIITKDGAKMLRNYEIANEKGKRQEFYRYAPGTASVLTTRVFPVEVLETKVKKLDQPMETDA